MNPILKLALPLSVVIFATGCSSELKGTVSFDNHPLDHGTVQVRDSDGLIHSAEIQPDGTYSFPSLPTGLTLLSVTCRDPREVEHSRSLSAGSRPGGDARFAEQPRPSFEFSLIPENYSDLDKSGLATTLRSGKNQFDVELK